MRPRAHLCDSFIQKSDQGQRKEQISFQHEYLCDDRLYLLFVSARGIKDRILLQYLPDNPDTDTYKCDTEKMGKDSFESFAHSRGICVLRIFPSLKPV